MTNKKFIKAIDAIDTITIADPKKQNAIILTGEKFKKNDDGHFEITKYKMHVHTEKENKYTSLFKRVARACRMFNDKSEAIKLLNLLVHENNGLLFDVTVVPTEESKEVYDAANVIFGTR